MWSHTRDAHNSIIGPDKGAEDYKMIPTGFFKSNLARLVDEGKRQTLMEEYPNKQVIKVLNSKIDFIQPLRTKLTILNKNINYAPGKLDRQTTQPNKYNNRKPLRGKRRLTEPTSIFNPRLTSTPEKFNLDETNEYIRYSPVKKKIKFSTQNILKVNDVELQPGT